MSKISLGVLSQVLLFFVSANSFAQALDSQDADAQLVSSRDLVFAIESREGRDSPELIEPLTQLANSLTELGRFVEAHRILERAMQITRFDDGLYTESQVPLIQQKIENFSEGRDWSSAREQMDHLFWFYDTQQVSVGQGLIDDLVALSDQHLRGVAEDIELWQGYHLIRAHQLNWAIISSAEKVYAENNPRRIPLLYRQLQHLYLLKQAVEGRAPSAADLRRIIRDSGRLRDAEEVVNSYFFVGLGLLDQIRNVYVDLPSADAQGQAMTNLYTADWHLLFDRPEQAMELYARAHDDLMQAGVPELRLLTYFSEPRVLPLQQFYGSVDLALTETAPADSMEEGVPTLEFTEWSSAFASVPGKGPTATENEAENFALFSFQLSGENEYSRWFKGKITRAISSPFDGTVLRGLGVRGSEGLELLEKLENLHFRPKLSSGVPQQSSAMLRYYLANNL